MLSGGPFFRQTACRDCPGVSGCRMAAANVRSSGRRTSCRGHISRSRGAGSCHRPRRPRPAGRPPPAGDHMRAHAQVWRRGLLLMPMCSRAATMKATPKYLCRCMTVRESRWSRISPSGQDEHDGRDEKGDADYLPVVVHGLPPYWLGCRMLHQCGWRVQAFGRAQGQGPASGRVGGSCAHPVGPAAVCGIPVKVRQGGQRQIAFPDSSPSPPRGGDHKSLDLWPATGYCLPPICLRF